MKMLQKMKFKSLKKKLTSLRKARLEGQGSDETNKKEIDSYLALAKIYDKHIFDQDMPKSEIYSLECYRAAAELGDPNAIFITGKRLFERGRFWDEIADEELFEHEAHQAYAKRAYDEAFNYIRRAEEKGHPIAKRLHGQAYINGWGLPQDEDKGIRLIVESINQQNAWDKATKILEELGLNTPEFFSTIMSLKNSEKPQEGEGT